MSMYDKFAKLLEENHITPYRIHKETGISTATLSDWKNGKSEPKKDKIAKICQYFKISMSYFYEEEQEKQENKKDINTSNAFDIKKHIDEIMESLEGKEKIVYEGKEVTLSEQNKRLLRYAMEIAYEAAKNHKQ